jgi:cytochrome c oxidase assembly factor CtaG
VRLILGAMHPASTPLTFASILGSWQVDVSAGLLILLVGGVYGWGLRRRRQPSARIDTGPAWCFALGCAFWAIATMSMIGVYSGVLFWVRALQILMLLFLVPFLLALGRPLTVLRATLRDDRRDRFDRLLCGRAARVLAHPATTSIAMLGTPWLLYLTPWYRAALESPLIAAGTNAVLVLIGFGYFYARLQADPVPRRYSQLISVVISIVETIGDGVLGLVLWLGPLVAADYYEALHRTWGPSLRLDQTIGAGILWIVGDVLGLPFLIMLMRALSVDEHARSVEVDEALDRAEAAHDGASVESGLESATTPAATSTLWWENDPQLKDRYGR